MFEQVPAQEVAAHLGDVVENGKFGIGTLCTRPVLLQAGEQHLDRLAVQLLRVARAQVPQCRDPHLGVAGASQTSAGLAQR